MMSELGTGNLSSRNALNINNKHNNMLNPTLCEHLT